MPAVVDTDDGLFVVKFRGAGQGPKALIAEIICAEVARALDVATPELALVDIPESFGRSEPDPEIQDILRASHGVNVGFRFLDGVFNFALAAARDLIDEDWAARVVWLDAFLTNPDRTHRNTNILLWDRRPWLIDHGAAIYAQHDWPRVDEARTRAGFPLIRDHVLLSVAGDLAMTDQKAGAALGEAVIRRAVEAVPDELLRAEPLSAEFATPEAARDRYAAYLLTRLEAPRAFVDSAIEAQRMLQASGSQRLSSRR
jgi:hypothetical protein